MTRWEYRQISLEPGQWITVPGGRNLETHPWRDLADVLNRLGLEGWEVSVLIPPKHGRDESYLLLKRALPESR